MGLLKKLSVFIIAVTVLFTGIKINNIDASAASSQVETAISRARSMLGSNAFNGYCQRFVRICYEYAGISGWAPSAALAGNYWIVSYSRDNIPVGATVYFTANSEYGHVGIYVGNGCMIHAYNGVREEPISDYWWARFRGWGYQGGVIPTGTYVETDGIPPVLSNISVTRNENETFCLNASVSDNKKLSHTVFALENDKGDKKFYQAAVSDGIASAFVPFSDFDRYEGTYISSATAVDAAGNQTSLFGTEITIDVTPPEITDVRITGLAPGCNKISFNVKDSSSVMISCYVNGKSFNYHENFFDDDVNTDNEGRYYFYAYENGAFNAKICVKDVWGYSHEKIIEAADYGPEDDIFFSLHPDYGLFRPHAVFQNNANDSKAIMSDVRKVSYEKFRIESIFKTRLRIFDACFTL